MQPICTFTICHIQDAFLPLSDERLAVSSGQPTQQAVVGVEGNDRLDRGVIGIHCRREAQWGLDRKRAERAASSDKSHGKEQRAGLRGRKGRESRQGRSSHRCR